MAGAIVEHGKTAAQSPDRAFAWDEDTVAESDTASATFAAAAAATTAQAVGDAHIFPDNTSLDVLREVARLAEKNLDAQLVVVGALAQRAGALAGMFGAGSLAMLAVELSFLTLLQGELSIVTYGIALLAPSTMFVGCTLCGRAAGTSKFDLAGGQPKRWAGNVTKEDLNDGLIGEITNYQKYLENNTLIISQHAKSLRWGLRLGLSSPIMLVIVGAGYVAYQGGLLD